MKSQQSQFQRRKNALDYIFGHALELLHKLGLTDTTEMHAGWLCDYLLNKGRCKMRKEKTRYQTENIINVRYDQLPAAILLYLQNFIRGEYEWNDKTPEARFAFLNQICKSMPSYTKKLNETLGDCWSALDAFFHTLQRTDMECWGLISELNDTGNYGKIK